MPGARRGDGVASPVGVDEPPAGVADALPDVWPIAAGMSWGFAPPARQSRPAPSAAERDLGTVPATRGLSAAPGWSIRVIDSSWLRGRFHSGLGTRVIGRQWPFVSESGPLHPLGGAALAAPGDARRCPPEGTRIASFGVKMPPAARAFEHGTPKWTMTRAGQPPDNRRTVRRIGGARVDGRITRSVGPAGRSRRGLGPGRLPENDGRGLSGGGVPALPDSGTQFSVRRAGPRRAGTRRTRWPHTLHSRCPAGSARALPWRARRRRGPPRRGPAPAGSPAQAGSHRAGPGWPCGDREQREHPLANWARLRASPPRVVGRGAARRRWASMPIRPWSRPSSVRGTEERRETATTAQTGPTPQPTRM